MCAARTCGSVPKESLKRGGAMRWVLAIVAVLALLFSVLVFSNAGSAIHEIEALMGALIFAVCFGAAAIIEQLRSSFPPGKP